MKRLPPRAKRTEYLLTRYNIHSNQHIVVVGVGGTGGFVAEGLCRLLVNEPERTIILIDHDRVEQHNLLRQNFYPEDIGKFKSQALAERLSQRFGRAVSYATTPFTHSLFQRESWWIGGQAGQGSRYGAGFSMQSLPALVLGCVDNPRGRKELSWWCHSHNILWVDSGNDEYSGQILVGNMELPGPVLDAEEFLVSGLPSPAVQAPILIQGENIPVFDCAEEIVAGRQSATVNQQQAALMLEVVRQVLAQELKWLALYANFRDGVLKPLKITPENLARVWQCKEAVLFKQVKKQTDYELTAMRDVRKRLEGRPAPVLAEPLDLDEEPIPNPFERE